MIGELWTLVKICKDLSDWMEEEQKKINDNLSPVQEIDIVAVMEQVRRVKEQAEKILDNPK